MMSVCSLERRKGGFYEDSESKMADITAEKISEANDGQDENSAGAVVKTHDEQRQQVLETM